MSLALGTIFHFLIIYFELEMRVNKYMALGVFR